MQTRIARSSPCEFDSIDPMHLVITMPSEREALVRLLRSNPRDPELPEHLAAVESMHPADLGRDLELLRGVWDLRWSSSSQPWLRHTPWLDNLQVLDPARGQGCNLLRFQGPLGSLGSIRVQADLTPINQQRIGVRFRRGGWVGPKLMALGQPKLLREVQQSLPAWLDITVLDEQLRICRGNAGTVFALLKRPDLNVADFLP